MQRSVGDDRLMPLPTQADALDLLFRTRDDPIKNGNLRLHKIASNNAEVMNKIPVDDLAENQKAEDETVVLPLNSVSQHLLPN
ncbi:uncharacterized protein LOC128232474 isoform X2 [Mya arenaria]|uniref:uncharacterized protein LOC128232474 isoform X2 n=1 Tax=Mya arenaria TaxID=6604 RepID=UPI0022E72798|nr:uncharacterized protein LOC128232474 isoform X2 [Mya arenaria]